MRVHCALTTNSCRFCEAAIAVECRQIQEGMLTASNKSGAIPALIGLRFVAALMVFFYHDPIHGSEGWPKDFPTLRLLRSYILFYTFWLHAHVQPPRFFRKYASCYYTKLSALTRCKSLPAICLARPTTDTLDLLLIHLFLIQAWYGDVDVAMRHP